MTQEITRPAKADRLRQPVLIAELLPPQGADAAAVREAARATRERSTPWALPTTATGSRCRPWRRPRRSRRRGSSRSCTSPRGTATASPWCPRPWGAGPGHSQSALHQRQPPDARTVPRRQERLRRRSGPAAPDLLRPGERRRAGGREGDRRRRAVLPGGRGRAGCRSAGPANPAAGQEGQGGGEVPHHAADLRRGAFRGLVGGGHAAWAARASRRPGRHPAALRRRAGRT